MKFIAENWHLILMALVSGGMLLWPLLRQGAGGATSVSTAEAVRLINREKGVLVDVCEPDEYAAGHAGGARNVPLSQLAATIDSGKGLPTNKTLPVIVDGYDIAGTRTLYEPYGAPLTTPREGAPSYTGHQYDTSTGMLYAQQHGVFRRYNDLVFDRFWRREVDPEDVAAVGALLILASVLVAELGGRVLLAKKNLPAAQEALLEVLRFVPDHLPSQLLLGAIAFQNNNLEQADAYLSRYVTAVPNQLPARKLLGRSGMHIDGDTTWMTRPTD